VVTGQGDELWALPADHLKGTGILPRIRRNGKTILYGHDSGIFPEATLKMLSDGIPIDIAFLDATFGALQSENREHMGLDGILQMTGLLRKAGAFTDATRVIATHFSHNCGMNHEALVKAFAPHGIEIAYDGLCLCL